MTEGKPRVWWDRHRQRWASAWPGCRVYHFQSLAIAYDYAASYWTWLSRIGGGA